MNMSGMLHNPVLCSLFIDNILFCNIIEEEHFCYQIFQNNRMTIFQGKLLSIAQQLKRNHASSRI